VGQQTEARVSAPDAAVIRARGLSRRFGPFLAVEALDLVVSRGEVFGLLGANGAGKTTTIRMLCGTLPLTAGDIRVVGIDMVRHARRARAHIGYVSQRFALYEDLTVEENLRLQAGLYGLTGARRRERILWALEQLELAPRRRHRARDLPLGYKKRLALGAALLHEPQVLFLDEPTSGVDPLARQTFWEMIYSLAEGGIGILATTHYMDEAAFCDRLALMHAGRIAAEGSPDDLLERRLEGAILTLRALDCARCAQWLGQWVEVREVIPHAGRLRARLQPGVEPEALMRRLRAAADQKGIAICELAVAAPELEDVFVSVLEEAGAVETRP